MKCVWAPALNDVRWCSALNAVMHLKCVMLSGTAIQMPPTCFSSCTVQSLELWFSILDLSSSFEKHCKAKFGTECLGWGLHGPPTSVHDIHECRTLRWLLQCIVLVSPPDHPHNDDNDHHDHQQDHQSGNHTCYQQCYLRLCRTLEVWNVHPTCMLQDNYSKRVGNSFCTTKTWNKTVL